MSVLTGRTRYRVTWFGRLVLQVEAERDVPAGVVWVGALGPELKWRDARCEDFTPPHLAGLFASAPIPFPGQKPPTE